MMSNDARAIDYDWFTRRDLRGLHFASGPRLLPDFLNVDSVEISCCHEQPGPKDGVQHFEAGAACLFHRDDGAQPFKVTSAAPCLYLRHDARRPLALVTSAVDAVFAEHFLEHLTPEEAVLWLREMRRILRPGGVLRLSTPDLARYVAAYLGEDPAFARAHLARLQEAGLAVDHTSRGWFVNQVFKGFLHRWIYDFDEVVHVAGAAGFRPEAVRRAAFGVSALPSLSEIDWEWRRPESLYVELSRD